MKEKIAYLVREAAKTAYEKGELPSPILPEPEIEEPRDTLNGDFSTNISMKMASIQKMQPRKIAEAILKQFGDPDGMIRKIEIAGPGFVNFFINLSSWQDVIRLIHETGIRYGASDMGGGKKVQVEFVSSNPTGPLHVGHGRGAAVGDSLANILSFCGYEVEKEYYINDSGRQIATLGRSVFLRLKELLGERIQFPQDCYQGDYIRELANQIKEQYRVNFGDGKDKTCRTAQGVSCLDMADEDEATATCARFAAENILCGMQKDLESFGVVFDNWFSEQSLYDSGKVDDVINNFRKLDVMYQKDGALWFKTKDFGDEKDRVVVKKDGQTTYFASDIAYHQNKFERGFDKIINVWGADHHGYIQRISASIEASGLNKNRFGVILVQLVNLLRDGKPVAMSTRAGEFVMLRDVVNEVGRDAARFIFLTRHHESPLEFDLEIAQKKTNENPVYYVQYVHARISSIVRKAMERGIKRIVWDDRAMAGLNNPEEIQLIKTLARYPDTVKASAESMEPHRITFYLMDLASNFHAYYNKHRVLTDERELTLARLYLVVGVQTVIRSGLTLLGVSAPDKM